MDCMYTHKKSYVTILSSFSSWKWFQNPATDEGIHSLCYLHLVEYSLTIRRNEVVIYIHFHMGECSNHVLSERHHRQTIIYRKSSFTKNVSKRQKQSE